VTGGASIAARAERRLRRRRAVDRAMRALIWVSAVLAVLPLVLVVFYVARKGVPAINLALFTRDPSPLGDSSGGIRPALVGSLIMVGLGTAFGVPIAVGTAIYVREYAGERPAMIVRFLIDVLAGVPTIIVGLFIYGLLVVPMGAFSAIAGGVALAIILVPIVARITDEMLGVVPNSMREAAYALGIPRWKTIVRIVLPAAASGIVTGIVLSVARIAGEAAPLIFTALGNSVTSTTLTKPMDALPLRIWVYASGPYPSWHDQAWAASLVLVGLVLCFALILRFALQRSRQS
jgi:phosphate transport system permease protein